MYIALSRGSQSEQEDLIMGEAKRRQAKASVVWAASDHAYHEAAHGVISDKYGIEVINLAIANEDNDLAGLHARTSFVTPLSVIQHEYESNPERHPVAEWERLSAHAIVNDLRGALAGAAIDLGAVAICVGIDFGAISSVTRLPDHAARSIA